MNAGTINIPYSNIQICPYALSADKSTQANQRKTKTMAEMHFGISVPPSSALPKIEMYLLHINKKMVKSVAMAYNPILKLKASVSTRNVPP